MITVFSLMYMRPKAHVRPSRHSRAIAPITHDLRARERQRKSGGTTEGKITPRGKKKKKRKKDVHTHKPREQKKNDAGPH